MATWTPERRAAARAAVRAAWTPERRARMRELWATRRTELSAKIRAGWAARLSPAMVAKRTAQEDEAAHRRAEREAKRAEREAKRLVRWERQKPKATVWQGSEARLLARSPEEIAALHARLAKARAAKAAKRVAALLSSSARQGAT